MRKLAWLGLLLATFGVGTMGAGCTVRETRVARPGPPPPCRGGYWVEGHYGPRGQWRPAHWRCPGAVERIEIY